MGHPTPDAEINQRHGPHPAAVIGVLVAFLAFAVFGFVYLAGSDNRTAKNACISAVTDQLRSPASARWNVTLITDQGGGVRIVNGTVDAQNGFGAMIRSNFRCTVTNGVPTVDFVG
jgi:hypothetical protein